MISQTQLIFFIVTTIVFVVIPGPSVLYIVTRSIAQGRAAGVASVLGIATGTLVHVTAAALGLSALLMSSALAFDIVKYAGAAYLIYLGVRRLCTPTGSVQDMEIHESSLARIYWQGFVVNLLNPKTALFFLSFLPQFAQPEQGSITSQILLLGVVFVVVATTSDSLYALVASSARGWLQHSRYFALGQRYVTGSVYIALGTLSAFSGAKHT